MPLKLTSPAFADGTAIPRIYTQCGDNISPPLSWDGIPQGTKSFVLMLDGQENGHVRSHWVLFNLDSSQRELPEHVPHQDLLHNWTQERTGIRQGVNDFEQVGYSGPRPDSGPPHQYAFTLYALDCVLHAAPGSHKRELLATMEGHVLEHAELIGVYADRQ